MIVLFIRLAYMSEFDGLANAFVTENERNVTQNIMSTISKNVKVAEHIERLVPLIFTIGTCR